jgi:hypothetical protein
VCVAQIRLHNPRHGECPCAAQGAPDRGADDDVLLREGLASVLDRSGFEIVGQAGDAAGLLRISSAFPSQCARRAAR